MEASDPIYWLAIGLFGQAAFSSRFLVQWVASERAGRSNVPVAFWYLSLLGSFTLLVYAIHREEPVFALGQSLGSVVYIRNLMLLRRTAESTSEASGYVGPGGMTGKPS